MEKYCFICAEEILPEDREAEYFVYTCSGDEQIKPIHAYCEEAIDEAIEAELRRATRGYKV